MTTIHRCWFLKHSDRILSCCTCNPFFDSIRQGNILDMRICNGNRNSFVIFEPSLHHWLMNKSKSCRNSIRDNYNDNYVNWSLRNLLSIILSTYINLNCFIYIRSIASIDFLSRQFRICRLTSTIDLNQFCVI